MKKQPELETVLKELHNISGFRISVYDVELREIGAYPPDLSPFCSFLQQNPEVHRICVKNDRDAFEKVRQTGEVFLYRCRFGLYEAVAPLYHLGVLSGYLMMGQTLDNLSDSPAYVYRYSRPYVTDADRLRQEIEGIPVSTRDKILSCITIMDICAEYITLTNRLSQTSQDLAQEVRKYLNAHYQEKLTIDGLCSRFFCSRSTLMNAFSRIYQETVNHYLTGVRLEQSRRLLLESRLTIRQIAEECGFSDQNYFCKVFVKAHGKTPSEFRSQRGS